MFFPVDQVDIAVPANSPKHRAAGSTTVKTKILAVTASVQSLSPR